MKGHETTDEDTMDSAESTGLSPLSPALTPEEGYYCVAKSYRLHCAV